ncbi:Transcription factor MYB1R1, partial [Linum perenne]
IQRDGCYQCAVVGGGPGEVMLFGVRVVVDSMRKSVSLNNLSQYEHPSAPLQGSVGCNKEKDDILAAGYGSADDAVHHSPGPRSDRKRGLFHFSFAVCLIRIPLFWLRGALDGRGTQAVPNRKVGKGDWRWISRNFVKTRTPTQVASHAQKYFLRRLNTNRRRRRSSLFDITTDTVTGIPTGEEQANLKKKNMGLNQSATVPIGIRNINNFTVMPAFTLSSSSPSGHIHMDNLSLEQQGNIQCIGGGGGGGGSSPNVIRPVQVDPSSLACTSSRTIFDVDLNVRWPADPLPLLSF